MFTSLGNTSLNAGTNNTSSNVKPSINFLVEVDLLREDFIVAMCKDKVAIKYTKSFYSIDKCLRLYICFKKTLKTPILIVALFCLINEINAVFNEASIDAEDVELDIEILTQEKIREVLQEADTIQPTTTAQQININATLYDFIRKYIVVGIGEDEDLVQYFEEYFLLLQDYQNADTFISAVLLLVPAFIKELKEEQGYSEYEIELDEDEEEYSD